MVDGVGYAFFQVGERYKFSTKKNGAKSGNDSTSSIDEVVIEITEPMEPCANLCKLSYINDPSLDTSNARVARCKDFIAALGQKDGLRGWYAKVITGGLIQVGDSISHTTSVTR